MKKTFIFGKYRRFAKYTLLLYLELTENVGVGIVLQTFSCRVPESNIGSNAFTRNEVSRDFTEFL